jgi:hypothetical protein
MSALTHQGDSWYHLYSRLSWSVSQPRNWLDVLTTHQCLVSPHLFFISPEARYSRLSLLYELSDDLGESLVLGREKEWLRQINPCGARFGA